MSLNAEDSLPLKPESYIKIDEGAFADSRADGPYRSVGRLAALHEERVQRCPVQWRI